MHMHNVPKCIRPKFADDLVAVTVAKDINEIQSSLQKDTTLLVRWAEQEGMKINAAKSKVMLFGGKRDTLQITIDGTELENVRSFKYLGVVLDPMLDFSIQADYAASKVKRASFKISTLIKGRKGLSVQSGIDLYKTLVRLHIEYAMPVRANISDKEMEMLEKVQLQCLRRVTGALTHSSSAAVEVVCRILPVRFRRRELCCREYIRIFAKDSDSELSKMMNSSIRVGLGFCPMEYIRTVSRELHRAMIAYDSKGTIISCLEDIIISENVITNSLTFTALMLLVEWQEEHPARKKT